MQGQILQMGAATALLCCPAPCRLRRSCSDYPWRSQTRRQPQRLRPAAVSGRNVNDVQLTPVEFFESFLRQRQAQGDLVSKASDLLWKKEILDEYSEEKRTEVREKLAEMQKMKEVDDTGSFLKLAEARNWSSGLEEVAPRNVYRSTPERVMESNDRKRQSLLEYEALKRELSLMTVGVSVFCTVYCLLVLSIQSAVSFDIGAGASLLYLQLLYRKVDRVNDDTVPEIFRPKRFKTKKIGIRSDDVKQTLEKTIRGCEIALSSSRLVIPAALFGLWAFLNHSTQISEAHLEVAPMILGFFAYKAAALIQAYRDNKELIMIFEGKQENEN